MVHEGVLLESPTLRASVAERTDALDRTKALSLLADGTHVTTRMVAGYFEVGLKAVESVVHDHRDELESNGYRVLTGAELASFKEVSSLDKRVGRHLALFSRRTVLNVAMLLRDSVVARQVRTYLLDAEQRQSFPQAAPPVDNAVVHSLVEWLDARIAEAVARAMEQQETRLRQIAEDAVRTVLGQAVVPLLSHAIQADRERRGEMSEIRRELARIDRALRERAPGGGPTTMDAMTRREFEDHVAGLCRRDGCFRVTGVASGAGTTGAGTTGRHRERPGDLLGRTADGRSLLVRCLRVAPYRKVGVGELREFSGLARREYGAEVALFVTTATFTPDALDLAVRQGVTAVHRRLLESWSGGAKLHALG